jgi:hypothetical protein
MNVPVPNTESCYDVLQTIRLLNVNSKLTQNLRTSAVGERHTREKTLTTH